MCGRMHSIARHGSATRKCVTMRCEMSVQYKELEAAQSLLRSNNRCHLKSLNNPDYHCSILHNEKYTVFNKLPLEAITLSPITLHQIARNKPKMCGRNRGPGRCSRRNGPPFGHENRQGLVGMLVRHIVEKRDAKRTLTQQPDDYKQQPYTYDPLPVAVGRRSLETGGVWGQGQGQREENTGRDWVEEKEALDLAEAIRLSREMAGMRDTERLPTYGQVMKQ